MGDLQLLIDLHKRAERQGPGGEAETKMALELTGLAPSPELKIADIGCGTGSSALLLARLLQAQVTAVDFLPEFLEVLKERAAAAGLSQRITPLPCSMEKLPFKDEEYDLLWSEGAIYNIGFEKGIQSWRPFLKPGGTLVVSEITWTTGSRPDEVQQYWDAAYPEIDTAAAKMHILEQSGYSPVGYFALPEYCWLENYYRPLQNSFADFLARNSQSDAAQAIVAAEEEEIALYERFKGCYSYGMYIARKTG